MKIVFNYHPVTLEYTGTSEANESPLEPGVYLIPAHATEIAPPAPVAGQVRVFKNNAWGYVRIASPGDEPTTEPVPIDLAAYAREKSWQVRIAGTTIEGVSVQTDDASISLITAMAALAERQPERVFEFDTAAGPVTLTAAQASAFSVAVGDWVQSTFDTRAAVLRAIAAGDITTTEQIDTVFMETL